MTLHRHNVFQGHVSSWFMYVFFASSARSYPLILWQNLSRCLSPAVFSVSRAPPCFGRSMQILRAAAGSDPSPRSPSVVAGRLITCTCSSSPLCRTFADALCSCGEMFRPSVRATRKHRHRACEDDPVAVGAPPPVPPAISHQLHYRLSTTRFNLMRPAADRAVRLRLHFLNFLTLTNLCRFPRAHVSTAAHLVRVVRRVWICLVRSRCGLREL